MEKKERAGVGALEGLSADCEKHSTPDQPKRKSQRDRARDLLTELRAEYPVLGEYRPLSNSTPPPAQRELFGLAVRADDRTTTAPCPRCGAGVAVIAPGSGPHYAAQRCLRGHFLRWLPKPGGAR